jgi:hypothetical protein
MFYITIIYKRIIGKMKKWSRVLLAFIFIASMVTNGVVNVFGESADYIYYLPLILKEYTPPVILRTNIDNISEFLEQCPNDDPIYSMLRSDFVIRLDGVIIGSIPCSEPISAMPIAEYTNALISLQVFRTAYYMDPGVSNFLPWTSMNLYDWMANNVGGVNLKTAPGQLYCCDYIDGERYISQSLQDEYSRGIKRTWNGISSTLDYFAHEIRHADYGPSHVTGCAAFPNPTDPAGCDYDYDLTNLGSYGVQYWLNQSWLTGYLDIGISCASDGGLAYALNHLNNLNATFRDRFVQNIPPIVSMPNPPYGGPCYAP